MILFGQKTDIAALQASYDDAALNTALVQESKTSIEEDIQNLRNIYLQDGFDRFEIKRKRLLDKWSNEKASRKSVVKLLKTIGNVYVSEGDCVKAQKYYDKALSYNSKNFSTMLSKAETYLISGDLQLAKDWFRRAFCQQQNVHTASKYAEILFFTGEKRENIQTIISGFLGHSLKSDKPTRSEAVILSLNLVLSSTDTIRRKHTHLVKENGFKDSKRVIQRITEIVQNLLDFNREEVKQHFVHEKIRKGFNKPALVSASEGEPAEDMDPITKKIAAAYHENGRIWDKITNSRAVSRDAFFATGTRGLPTRAA